MNVLRDLFAAAVRETPPDLGLVCTLIAAEVNGDIEVTGELSNLDAFAALARSVVDDHPATPPGQAEALRIALGEQAGFAGFADDYDDLRSSLLPDVLRRRRGLPILLTIVWLEVARRLEIPAYPIALPGHVIAGIGDPLGEHVLVDPFRGGRTLTVHDAAQLVRATGASFSRDLLAPTAPEELLLRVLANIRTLGTRLHDPRVRLWAVELSMLLPRHPSVMRRERGELLVRRGDFLDGARELESYADQISSAEPAAADAARLAARMARARLN